MNQSNENAISNKELSKVVNKAFLKAFMPGLILQAGMIMLLITALVWIEPILSIPPSSLAAFELVSQFEKFFLGIALLTVVSFWISLG